MNERKFKQNVVGVITIYCLAIAFGIAFKIHDPSKDAPLYTTFKDLVPLIIAIPAAWLGYCFQRRQSYLKDVRELWSKIVVAVQDSIQYTHLSNAEQLLYGNVLKGLSVATEELRAVFTNIGEGEEQVGLFPFESLKSIHEHISVLGYNEISSDEASSTRHEIVESYKKLRRHFLTELERGIPSNVDSPFLQ